ncbi:hypothetical protein LOK49_LG02G00320 [Camellia lanceoleosa]|uniref:Uncharacterized protein n=1 Tax=Camellia lanceoleosa TaxID=1840588 RepID=A0ACC0ITK6_9ERIC|nr:hypothetical protein LOK49_LG02G00320 [Camellia lanceoleosa]
MIPAEMVPDSSLLYTYKFDKLKVFKSTRSISFTSASSRQQVSSFDVVIAKLEGPAVSQYCALRLLQAALDESSCELAGEFLLISGREYEPSTKDLDKVSPRFLSYFLFPSTCKIFISSATDRHFIIIIFFGRSPSFKKQNAHVASVKNILESRASYLIERYGSARLENFALGLELIGQKLQMGTLQSRLDAEFLVVHMCSIKFKEWIVVLTTLLRRSEAQLPWKYL